MNTSSQPNVDKIQIIYEDDHLLVVNKPNNFLVHESRYARNIQEPTLLDKLSEELNAQVFPVHRLDRKTSGILLCAKQKEFVSEIQRLFTDNRIDKIYYAILRGFISEKFTVDSPVKNNDTGIYKDALTHGECLQQIELPIPVHPYDASRYSLVKLMPQTGRMHQLRIHMNKISHPIIGDYKYGDRFHNRMFETEFDCHYMFLHARTLAFRHPFTDKNVVFQADFPQDWNIMLNRFNWSV